MSETEFVPYGYEITRDGRVFSMTGWRGLARREMRQSNDENGYRIVRLTVNGRRRKYRVHQLVAWAFVGPRPSDVHEVRHLDGNPNNNNAANLAWGTRSENARDRTNHGRSYSPPWHDPVFREAQCAAMRRGHARARGRAV